MIDTRELRELVWFGLSIFVYVSFHRPHNELSVVACLIKAGPVLSLAFFVWNRGVRVASRLTYSKYIFLGLLFSAVGDTFLQLKALGLFIPGMAAFAVAHVLFVCAFGAKPMDLLVAVPVNLYGIVYYAYLYTHPRVTDDRPFAVALGIYCLVICTMFWRALARWRFETAVKAKNENKARWLFVGFLGAVSFVISDSMLSWWMVVGDYPNAREIIMGSYYIAQLLLSLSIFHEEVRGGRKQNANSGKIRSRLNGVKATASPPSSPDSSRLYDKAK